MKKFLLLPLLVLSLLAQSVVTRAQGPMSLTAVKPYVNLKLPINPQPNLRAGAAELRAVFNAVVDQLYAFDSSRVAHVSLTQLRGSSLSSTLAPKSVQVLDKLRAGVFQLDPSDTSSPDNTGLVVVTQGGLRYKRVLTSDGLSAKWFGAVGDSLTDDTQAMKTALLAASNNTLDINGIFRVSTNQLNGGSNLRIRFTPGSRIVTTSTSGNILSFANQNNVVINNGTFRAPNGNVKALYTSYSHNFIVDQITCYQAGVIRLEHSNRYVFNKPIGVQGTSHSGPACIDLNFFDDVELFSPYVDGYDFCIQFWGNDAAPLVNGVKVPVSRSQPKGCRNLRIHNPTVMNSIAGIWGSMGDMITVDGRGLAKNFLDVGIDAEGCTNVLFFGIDVYNAVAGGLAAFYNFDNVRFSYCRSYADNGYKTLTVKNGNTNQDAGRLVFDHCLFSSTSGVTDGYDTGGAKDLEVTDCRFENVNLDVHTLAGHNQKIENNDFVWKLPGGPVSLVCGNLLPLGTEKPLLSVQKNRFTNQYGLDNGAAGYGMQIYHLNASFESLFDRNEIKGYQLDLVLQPQNTTSAAQQASVRMSNNLFGAGQVFAAPPGGSNLGLILYKQNNRDGANNPVN